jgi:general secretion pathway protein L
VIGAFFAWWAGQLAELLPGWLRGQAPARSDALVVEPVEPLPEVSEVAAALRRGGKITPLGRFAVGSAELTRLPRSPRRPAVLRLPGAQVLEKRLSLPLAAEAQLDQALAFEMDRETPFAADEVYWNYRTEAIDRQQGRLTLRLVLVPKSRLAPLLSGLGRSAIEPKWIEVADLSEAAPVLPLDGDRARPERRSHWLVQGAAVACALLALGAAATPFARQAVERAALERQAAEGQAVATESETLHREIDRLSRSADILKRAQEKTGRPLDVLATVTRLLPDDTYLTEFELRQRKVTLGGRSAAAARLIGAFAADGKFRNPSFAAPVTRVEALHAEVFTIVAELEPSP